MENFVRLDSESFCKVCTEIQSKFNLSNRLQKLIKGREFKEKAKKVIYFKQEQILVLTVVYTFNEKTFYGIKS